ncbi:MAG: DegV family protein [Clostridiaceae bacterium]
MEKIAIITDTAADLSKDSIDKYNIRVLPFRIIYKDREYKDGVDITAEYVYRNLSKEMPKSSLPSMNDMDKLYENLENEGYTHVIAITLSSGLSGIYNGIKVVSESHNKIKSFVYDSKSISMGEGAFAIYCARLIEEGKSFEEIINSLDSYKKKIKLYFVVGTLEYLKKGGRIGKVAGTIAELLDIKPIISPSNEDGKYYTYAKVRGRKKSLNVLIKLSKEISNDKKYIAYLMSGDAKEETDKIGKEIEQLPNITKVILGGNISPVSGVHSGPGLVGLVLVEDETI